MYGYSTIKSFSIIKILTGLSKTLNIANQVLPIYQKAKPTITNARNIINTLKTINISDNKKNLSTIKKEEHVSSSNNNPVFFI